MTKENHAYAQAGAQLESIVEMVAAMECDYDRLHELREQRATLQCDADEASDSATADIERANLKAWDDANIDELNELRAAAGDCKDVDQARERIQEDALDVQVREDWHNPGDLHATPSEFFILLCTGGPAVRIMGEIDDGLQPSRAWIEYQDWGTPWTEYHGAHDTEALLTYCNCFFFGA